MTAETRLTQGLGSQRQQSITKSRITTDLLSLIPQRLKITQIEVQHPLKLTHDVNPGFSDFVFAIEIGNCSPGTQNPLSSFAILTFAILTWNHFWDHVFTLIGKNNILCTILVY
jgi:hypothetical protein